MRLHFYLLMFAAVALITSPSLADSNATPETVVNTETVSLGAGPFDHGDGIGSGDNTVISGVTFTGGFNATHIRFTGTLTSVLAPTWGSEADNQIRQGSGSFNWQNPGPSGTFSSFDYDSSDELTGDFAGGVDPGAGAWDVEFFDTFNDGAGADSQSTNVDMIFEEIAPISDTNGSFSLPALNQLDSASSVGEFATPSLYDLYTITLNQLGNFSFSTDEDPNGFVGNNVDTEIAIFDSAGNLVAEDDDSGPGLYSGIFDLFLQAGDYTLAVAPFLSGASFSDGFGVSPGTGTGDYTLNVSLAVPEPGSATLFGLAVGLLAYRRRRG